MTGHRYRFTADYLSARLSARAGQELELSEELVAWLERDVPGIIEPAGDGERHETAPPRNRQQRQPKRTRQRRGDS